MIRLPYMGNIFMSTLFKNGQFTIPVQIRKKWGLKPGDKVNFIIKNNAVVMQPAHPIKP